MTAAFIVVPQWQGSGSSRAMRLIDGAEAIGGDLPASASMAVAVPSGAGSSLDTKVDRLSSVQFVRDEMLATLHDTTDIPIVIGGDCGVDLAGVTHAARHGDVAVLWIDAHPDLNTPDSSPSGAFHGMVLRTLLGEGPVELVPPTPLDAAHVVLVGARAADDAEDAFIAASGITRLSPGDVSPSSVTSALAATGASRVYLHIDLDVLDPAEFECVSYPEPFGLTMASLLDVIGAARAALPLAGASVCEFAPASPESASDDMPTILRIVGALTKKL